MTRPFPSAEHPEWGPVVKYADISANPEAIRRAVAALAVPSLLWCDPAGGDRVRRGWVKLADAAAVRERVVNPPPPGRKRGAA